MRRSSQAELIPQDPHGIATVNFHLPFLSQRGPALWISTRPPVELAVRFQNGLFYRLPPTCGCQVFRFRKMPFCYGLAATMCPSGFDLPPDTNGVRCLTVVSGNANAPSRAISSRNAALSHIM